MKKFSGILAVSLFAIMMAPAARADLAATSYVDDAVSGKQDKSNMATGEYTSGSTTQYPSIKVAETIAKTAAGAAMPTGALAQKDTVGTNEIDDDAVTTDKIADANVTKGKLEASVQTSLGKADAALPKATYDSQVGTVSAINMGTTATTVVTAIKEAVDEAAAAQSTANAANSQATTNKNAITTLNGAENVDGSVAQKIKTATDTINTNIDKKADKSELTTAVNTINTALAGKQATLTTGDNGNIKGTGSVTVSKGADGVITVDGTDTKYTLPAATTSALGGVKSGGNITVASDGAVTVNQAAKATTADSATKATQDGNGKVIADTYQVKGSYITVPAAEGTNGKSVLTYDSTTKTYYWETIGR